EEEASHIERVITLKARQGWEDSEIERVLASRRRCGLCRLAADPDVGFVRVAPRGAPRPVLMVGGEGPGYEEDRRGQAVARGAAARPGMTSSPRRGIPAGAVRWSHCLRCSPHDEAGSPRRPDLGAEAVPCLPYLWDEIAQVEPKVIVSLGATSTGIFLGQEHV